MQDGQNSTEYWRFELERASKTFIVELLRHLAGGSSEHKLTVALKDFHEAMVNAKNWANIGEVISDVWLLSGDDDWGAESYDDVDYWLTRLRQPALRLAACQFTHSPLQESKATTDMIGYIKEIERIREGNRQRRALF